MDSEGQETIQPQKKDDSVLALAILVVAVIIGIFLLVNYWRSTKSSRQSIQANSSFTPPPERAAYLEAKERLDISNPTELDELKKLLMKRALKAIPLVLSLQNEGSSIERLYKKGMLTDDMHFKVKELKAFVDSEFQDVQSEAEGLFEGWGQMIWPQAMQFHQMIQKQNDKSVEKEEPVEKKPESQKNKKEGKKNEKKESKVTVSMPTSDEAKALEAERNAKQLLEEEEREKMNKAKKGGKGNKSNKK